MLGVIHGSRTSLGILIRVVEQTRRKTYHPPMFTPLILKLSLLQLKPGKTVGLEVAYLLRVRFVKTWQILGLHGLRRGESTSNST